VEGDDSPDYEASHHLPISDPMDIASGASGSSMAVVGQASSQLQQLDLDTRSVHLPSVQREWDNPKKDISKLDNVYLQPPTANNASWDAYYTHGDQRYVLQYTVSRHHGIKQAPIRQLLDRLQLGTDKVQLVFVVPVQPAELYDTFSWQPWQGVRGTLLAPNSWLGVEQWVMKLPLGPQPGQSRSPSSGGSISKNAGTP